MITNLKALVVVLAIASAVFILAKPICLRFMAEDDFIRRRNVWYVLTATAFISPSFWLFVLVAVPLLYWSGQKDTNPVALYLFVMHIISPNDALQIPAVGINYLFELNAYRIASFSILIPAAWMLWRRPPDDAERDEAKSRKDAGRLFASVIPTPHVWGMRRSRGRRRPGAVFWMDVLVIAWIALQLILYLPYDSVTHTVRRGFLFFVDVLVLYYVVSRLCTKRHAIVEAMAAFVLVCTIYAPLAVFESLKSWLLYAEIGEVWATPPNPDYLFRSGTLRAQVSVGHALTLGYLISMAIGFWLYLRSLAGSTLRARMVVFWLSIGLLASYSRGPWLVALGVFLAYVAFANGLSRLLKTSFGFALIGGAVLISPLRDRVIANLPFVGTVDAHNVLYRQRLAEKSWELIQENPFLGDLFFMSRLEDLRQGQGIIDLMNAYAAIGMSFGVVGLLLVFGFFLVGMWGVYRYGRNSLGGDEQEKKLGLVLIVCMGGTLIMLSMGGMGTGVEKMFYILAGLAAGYVQFGYGEATRPAIPAPTFQPQSSFRP
jgi:hypothetical protein